MRRFPSRRVGGQTGGRGSLFLATDGFWRDYRDMRLNVFPLSIPPLRERRRDIPLLLRHFVRKHGARLGKQVETVPRPRIDDLKAYAWPGNVRELENVVERSLILSSGPELNLGDWAPGPAADRRRTPGSKLADVERDHILETLELSRWRIGGERGAAKILGLKRTTLQGRMRKLGIRRAAWPRR